MSGLPGLTQPVNIFTFGPYLDQVLLNTNEILTGISSIIENQNTSLANENTILENQDLQIQQLTSLNTQMTTLIDDIAATVQLLQVTIQGISGVASFAVQQQELALLETIAENVAPTRPIAMGIDFANVSATRNPNPPTSVGP